MILFQVDDGGTHIISAESIADALEIAAESYGLNLAEYMDECLPKIVAYTDPWIVFQDDEMAVPKEFQLIAAPCLRIHRDNYSKIPKGLLSTTEF